MSTSLVSQKLIFNKVTLALQKLFIRGSDINTGLITLHTEIEYNLTFISGFFFHPEREINCR